MFPLNIKLKKQSNTYYLDNCRLLDNFFLVATLTPKCRMLFGSTISKAFTNFVPAARGFEIIYSLAAPTIKLFRLKIF